MPKAPDDFVVLRTWQKRLMIVVALAAALHSALLVLWLSPTNPVRDAFGGNNLAAYVDPYFQQSWADLEPSAQSVDESFRIRANVQDLETGKQHVTRWLDVTASEQAALRHAVPQARVHVIARRLATNLNGAMFSLNRRQRQLVTVNYIQTPISTLERRLIDAGSDAAAVQNYLAYDRMAVRFASLYADALWDGKILEVQYLVGRRTVPAFGERHQSKLAEVRYSWFAFGYRAATRSSYEARTAFDSYLTK